MAKDIPQLQEIAGKVWKKEDELKQLKSELAALDRKIQLELAPSVPNVAQEDQMKETNGKEIHNNIENTSIHTDNIPISRGIRI